MVLLKTVINFLDIKKGGKYIDATAGEGNLIKEILQRGGLVLGIDWDRNQIKKLQHIFKKNKNLTLVNDNFANLEKIIGLYNFSPVDGIIYDLGLSMYQLSQSKRGFSYKNLEENLDMRISLQLRHTAGDILNQFTKDELIKIFSQYGEEIHSQLIVNKIIETRKKEKIDKVKQLVEIIKKALGRQDESVYRRIFQALRIKVNNELENIKKSLEATTKIIKPKGKIIVISFHSLESRIVKQFIKKHHFSLITKKVIKGERSSQLRVFSLSQ